jgi:DNA mismatch repair protein MutS
MHVKARCLFATHYHELTTLAQQLPGIGVYHAASQQTAEGILLLHKILPGCTDGSFGIEVARMAHLPESLIIRAQEILQALKNQKNGITDEQAQEYIQRLQQEIHMLNKKLETSNVLLNQLKKIDYDMLSPKQAFDMMWKWKELTF